MNCLRLHKWTLLVRKSEDSAWEQNNVASFISAQLLETMESQAVRKFVAYHGTLEEADSGVLVGNAPSSFVDASNANANAAMGSDPRSQILRLMHIKRPAKTCHESAL